MTDPNTARALFMALGQDNSVEGVLTRTLKTAEELAADTKTCPDCGQEMSAGTMKCPNCGNDMSKESAAEIAAALTMPQRKNLSPSDFVFPEKAPGPGSYPIQDKAHGGYALQRSSGKPEEAKVRAVVCRRYSDLPSCK